MPHSELYQKILREAAGQARKPARPRSAGVAPARVSNAPVRHAPNYDAATVATLPLYEIARLIAADWHNVNYAARPYLDALHECDGNGATGGPARESAKSVALYFLNNAKTWRGYNARLIKAELIARFQ